MQKEQEKRYPMYEIPPVIGPFSAIVERSSLDYLYCSTLKLSPFICEQTVKCHMGRTSVRSITV